MIKQRKPPNLEVDRFLAEFVGPQLRKARQDSGYSLRQVEAAGVGMTHATIANIERGKFRCSFGNIYKLAKFYGMTWDELLPDLNT